MPKKNIFVDEDGQIKSQIELDIIDMNPVDKPVNNIAGKNIRFFAISKLQEKNKQFREAALNDDTVVFRTLK